MKLILASLIGVVFLLTISSINCIQPGLQIALSAKGLNYLAQVTSEYFNQNVTGLKLDEIDGSVQFKKGFISYTITYSIYDISIAKFSVGSTSMTSSSNKGVVFQINNINAEIQGQFHIDGDFFTATTTATISLANGKLVASASLGSTSDGRFNLSCTSCIATVGSVSVDFHGGSSWFFKVLDEISDFADLIQDKFQAICKLLDKLIDVDGNDKLKTFPIKKEINHEAIIDYSQTGSPYYDSKGMATFHKGEFTPSSNPSIKYNFTAKPFPFIRTNKMISFWLSEYVGNTAGITYQIEKSLKFLLSPETADNAMLRAFLNTRFLRNVLPQFYQKYPNMNYTIMVTSTKAPHVEIFEQISCLNVNVMMNFSTLTSNGSVPAFTTEAVVNVNTTAKIDANLILKVILKSMNGNLQLKSTEIGPISSNELKRLKVYFIDIILKGAISSIGRMGFQLPAISGVKFVNSSVNLHNGFVFIESDAIYKLSTKMTNLYYIDKRI